MPQLVEWVGEDSKGFSRKTTRPAHLRLIYLFYSVLLPAWHTSIEAPQSQSERVSICIPWGDWQIKTNQFSVTLLLACNKNTIFHLCYRSEGPITLIKPFSFLCHYDTPCLDGFKQATGEIGWERELTVLSVPSQIPVLGSKQGKFEPFKLVQSQHNRKCHGQLNNSSSPEMKGILCLGEAKCAQPQVN